MAFKHKDLLSLRDVEREEIEMILSTAASMRQLLDSPTKKTAHLQGKSIVTLFYENSTRTRMSFELASKYMSAAAANISAGYNASQPGPWPVYTDEDMKNALGMAKDLAGSIRKGEAGEL